MRKPKDVSIEESQHRNTARLLSATAFVSSKNMSRTEEERRFYVRVTEHINESSRFASGLAFQYESLFYESRKSRKFKRKYKELKAEWDRRTEKMHEALEEAEDLRHRLSKYEEV